MPEAAVINPVNHEDSESLMFAPWSLSTLEEGVVTNRGGVFNGPELMLNNGRGRILAVHASGIRVGNPGLSTVVNAEGGPAGPRAGRDQGIEVQFGRKQVRRHRASM